jgi:hypothetical protein
MFIVVVPGFAKDNPPDPTAKTVDSGSFGVFQDGKRIATETFSITQNKNGSLATSEFKMDKATGDAVQSSKLELTPNGDIVRYEWKEISPGNAEAYVAPNNDFLTEHYRDDPQAKEQQKPFLLPTSTSILDDYFFVQREILVWRYLATSCKTQKNVLQCPLKQEIKFGALNPHSRLSLPVSLTFLGPDDVTIRGVQKKLSKIELKSDTGDWALWLDEQFKLLEIDDASTNAQIVRD